MTDDAAAVIRWIRSNCRQFADYPLAADSPLLNEGGMDSLQIVELFNVLETMFGISVDVDELTPENFESVNHVIAMVRRVRRAA
jgi:acyl carrier protein